MRIALNVVVLSLLVGLVATQVGAQRRGDRDRTTGTRVVQVQEPKCSEQATKDRLPFCYDDDGNTQIDGMHACPAGFALAGKTDTNSFYCVYIGPYVGKVTIRKANANDLETQRQQSMACKSGEVVVGLHEVGYLLRCATTGATVEREHAQNAYEKCSGSTGSQVGVVTGYNTNETKMLCSMTYIK